MVEFKVGDTVLVTKVESPHWLTAEKLPFRCKILGKFNHDWVSVDAYGNTSSNMYGINPKWCILVSKIIQIW